MNVSKNKGLSIYHMVKNTLKSSLKAELQFQMKTKITKLLEVFVFCHTLIQKASAQTAALLWDCVAVLAQKQL